MEHPLERTELLVGREGIKKLSQAHIAVFGIGGVGGYVTESLVRSGVGKIDLIDKDIVSLSNINRQVVASHKTIGRFKVEVMKERCEDLNPDVKVNIFNCFFLPETADQFDFSQYDFVIDAVDTVTAKLELIERSQKVGTPIISCMGAGNKLNSTKFQVADLYDTTVCPLAKVMRRECRKRGIKSLPVVYSTEEPKYKGDTPGSTAFAPAVAGLLLAEEVFRQIVSDGRLFEENHV